jgi:hypothetical protein
MAKQEKTVHKKSRGRPEGSGVYVETIPVRLTKDMKKRVDQWSKEHGAMRSDALRALIERGLKGFGK